MAETISKYYAMDDSLLQYGQEGGETNPNATTMQDMQAYMKQNGDTLAHVVNSILWQPETDYVVGQEVHSPNLPAGYIAVCTVAGESGEVEPSWSTTYSTFTDGTVTWTIANLYSGKAPLDSPAFTTKATLDGDDILTEADVLTLEEIEASTSLADTDIASASALKDLTTSKVGYIDTSRNIARITSGGASWTATENAFITGWLGANSGNYAQVYINNVCIAGYYGLPNSNAGGCEICVPVKKGQIVTTREGSSYSYSLYMYGCLQ